MATDLQVGLALMLGLLIGAAGMLWFERRSGAAERAAARSLQAEIERLRADLVGQRSEVAQHFTATSDLFREMTQNYSRLYEHLADGAQRFGAERLPGLGEGLRAPGTPAALPGEAPAESAPPTPPTA